MIDHRKLGRELGIFHSDPRSGAGLPLWLPAGAAARHAVEEYLRDLEQRNGYQHVYSPPLGRRELFELSGHLGYFADDMFPPMRLSSDDELMLRPALCPHHCLVYLARGRSYRELPLRIAEIGGMYRSERSGVLGGLSRVRAIHLNDAHIFCALSSVGEEVASVLSLVDAAHAALGVRVSSLRLSLRGPGAKYIGSPESWEMAESLLRSALGDRSYVEAPGDAAFYGPKIDIQVADAAGREWTLSTVQLDFDKPERFDLSYVDASGSRQRPVLVHRSLVGSMERLFGYLIEAHEGAFPVWYAPVQVRVLPVSEGVAGAAYSFSAAAASRGLRVDVDVEGGSLGARIRDAAALRVPYVAVIGEREAAGGQVALRLRGGRELPPMPIADALRLIGEEGRLPS
ncbi:threonine--tRNA ligase [Asanoa sp. WMMD1127]|uniref:threonine--tRNA ligase n=1 Tax=Asanoa sp. WMMD1127 TaxID=3016107 RepID=UPI0024167790|nr:threonine--tRNA ligase [Asanoa sp. WMMD1127]MDG4822817.1 threonine--tRNA ligase [Asanoa sp. WMMD1127]